MKKPQCTIKLEYEAATELMRYLEMHGVNFIAEPAVLDSPCKYLITCEDDDEASVMHMLSAWLKERTDKVKSCPFCGGEAEVESVEKYGFGISYKECRVVCTTCKAGTRVFIVDSCYGSTGTVQDAINAWNKRV